MAPELETQKLIEFALDAVWQAGRITLGYFQSDLNVERKADNSPLTLADQQAEQKLRALIGAAWPQHGIIGEEYGEKKGSSGYSWVIDPIDGTKSFVAGVPLYATLLALTDGEKSILGVAHFPALGETLYAVRGGGCYRNGRCARVSQVDKLKDAVLLTSELNYFGAKEAAWRRLVDATYVQRTWGDAYGYFLVATGRAEIMVDPVMFLWDSAPFQVILEEAGGSFTDWKGNPTIYGWESVAANGKLFDQAMAVIQNEA